MNILHISRTMGQGGAEKVVYQLCNSCPSNINLFVASTGGNLADKLELNGVKQFIIPDIDKKNPFLMVKTIIILNRIIRKYNIDIIHSHHRMAAFYSRLLTFFNKKVKRVYTAHNVFYNKKKLLSFALNNSSIVAVGNGVKNNLVQIFNISADRVNIIYNSVEYPKRISKVDEISKLKKNTIIVAAIGRLSEQKGLDIFIKSISLCSNKVKALIVGDGQIKPQLLNLVNKLHLEDRVIFLGYRNDVLNIINSVDFVVLPSRWEGFPLTPIETFMMKKTIIATNIDGNNEIIKDQFSGLLFEKDNYVELSKKINLLSSDNKLRSNLENNAYNEYKKKYSYSTFINKYYKLYKSLR